MLPCDVNLEFQKSSSLNLISWGSELWKDNSLSNRPEVFVSSATYVKIPLDLWQHLLLRTKLKAIKGYLWKYFISFTIIIKKKVLIIQAFFIHFVVLHNNCMHLFWVNNLLKANPLRPVPRMHLLVNKETEGSGTDPIWPTSDMADQVLDISYAGFGPGSSAFSLQPIRPISGDRV